MWSGIIRRHTTLRLTDLEGGTNVGLMAYNAHQPLDRLQIRPIGVRLQRGANSAERAHPAVRAQLESNRINCVRIEAASRADRSADLPRGVRSGDGRARRASSRA